MEANNAAIYLSMAHLVYYLWFQVFADFHRMGMSGNSSNIEFDRLRSKYGVNIRTFQKNNTHYGFAWFKTIYLNETLLRVKTPGKSDPFYRLKWSFHHEHYHLMKHHKRNVLFHRFLFSLTPLLLMLHWSVFVAIYIAGAYGMYYLKDKVYERNANKHANEQMK